MQLVASGCHAARRPRFAGSFHQPLHALHSPLSCAFTVVAAGEGLIEEAVQLALANGWVKPLDHVVVLSRSQMDEFMVKARAGGLGWKSALKICTG